MDGIVPMSNMLYKPWYTYFDDQQGLNEGFFHSFSLQNGWIREQTLLQGQETHNPITLRCSANEYGNILWEYLPESSIIHWSILLHATSSNIANSSRAAINWKIIEAVFPRLPNDVCKFGNSRKRLRYRLNAVFSRQLSRCKLTLPRLSLYLRSFNLQSSPWWGCSSFSMSTILWHNQLGAVHTTAVIKISVLVQHTHHGPVGENCFAARHGVVLMGHV